MSDLYRPEFEEAAKERDAEFLAEVERRAGATREEMLALVATHKKECLYEVSDHRCQHGWPLSGWLSRILGEPK